MACLKPISAAALTSYLELAYKPEVWYTTLSFRISPQTISASLPRWIILSRLVGAGLFWSLYSARGGPVFWKWPAQQPCSSVSFCVQHNFEGLLRPSKQKAGIRWNWKPFDWHQSAAPASHPQLVPQQILLSQHPPSLFADPELPPPPLAINADASLINRSHPP